VPPGPLILSYHAVSASWPSRLAIEPHVLREQLGHLSRLGYVGLTVSEAERRRRDGTLPERALVVTFDDGYESTLRAEDILGEFGFPGTVFVVTSFAESGKQLLWPGIEMWATTEHADELRPADWGSLERLAAAGWEVGSHTVTHRLLTSLADDALEAELAQSREAIASRLGACTSLAYPYGVSDDRVEEAAARAGYEVACTLSFSHDRDAPHRRPRVELTTRDRGLRLQLQLDVIRAVRRTKAAPLVRKLRFGRHWLPLNAGDGLEAQEFNSNGSQLATANASVRLPRPDPLVTVLMCVRNGERYVMRAINSALTQTFDDFELVVVNDASTDGTGEVLSRITDPRLRVIRSDEQLGAAHARNLGMSEARGKYIAILDADDVSLPRRLEAQLEFMSRRPETVIVGSPTVVIDPHGVPRGFRSMPGTPLAVRWTAMMKSPFAHSSVVFRTEALQKFDLEYDQAFEPSEDYDLCARILVAGDGENVEYPLVFYRVHPDQLSITRRERQLRLHDMIVRRTVDAELPEFGADEAQLSKLWQLFSGISVDPAERHPLGHLYLDLFEAFRDKYAGDPDLDDLTRVVVQMVLYRCFVPPTAEWGGPLLRRLAGFDSLAMARFPVDTSALALRRTLWCRSPRIRRAAALAAFTDGVPLRDDFLQSLSTESDPLAAEQRPARP
jgi:glycosyltransferase involved in cell wall biosynthesis/peptidoglycan/xylan/chitin deacetylase (PgdA/CDA1 family)